MLCEFCCTQKFGLPLFLVQCFNIYNQKFRNRSLSRGKPLLSAITGIKKGMFCSNFNCYYSNILPPNKKFTKEWTLFVIYRTTPCKKIPNFNQIKTVARSQAGKQSLQSTTFNYYHRNILFSYFSAKHTHTHRARCMFPRIRRSFFIIIICFNYSLIQYLSLS